MCMHVLTGWPAVQISLLQNVWQTMKGVFTKRTTTREIAAPVFYKEKNDKKSVLHSCSKYFCEIPSGKKVKSTYRGVLY